MNEAREMRRFERRAARNYAHKAMSGRACYRSLRVGPCARCFWRSLTGQHRRDRAAHIARIRATRTTGN